MAFCGKPHPIEAARVEPQPCRIDQIGGFLGQAAAPDRDAPARSAAPATRWTRHSNGCGWRRPMSSAAATGSPMVEPRPVALDPADDLAQARRSGRPGRRASPEPGSCWSAVAPAHPPDAPAPADRNHSAACASTADEKRYCGAAAVDPHIESGSFPNVLDRVVSMACAVYSKINRTRGNGGSTDKPLSRVGPPFWRRRRQLMVVSRDAPPNRRKLRFQRS
jgi:hypothetical protein